MWLFRKKVETIEVKEEAKYDKTVLKNIRDFLLANPQIVYKGIPLAVAVYILYPFIMLGIGFLPHLFSVYIIYNSIPSWAITAVTLYFKRDQLLSHAVKMIQTKEPS